MKIRSNPKSLALYSTAIIIAFFSIVYIIFSYFFFEGSLLPLLLIDSIMAVFTYLLLRYVYNHFIYDKIRVIYKTIHRKKLMKGEKLEYLNKPDIIEDVNIEVENWEKGHEEEITKFKELEKYRREFIGNVSHELKTPIFNIQGYIQTLLDGGLEDPKINKTFLKRADKSVNRMIAIVDDLETISELESLELKLDFQDFDIVNLAKEVVEFLEMKARKKETRIFFREKYDKPIIVNADIKRIRQVLINLIENSIKYGKEKGGNCKISFFDMDENILIEVSDNGAGIAEKDLPRVFERFYRTDKARSRKQGGTGLGLAIVKHIMEAHNQTVNARSLPGVGTTFGLTVKKG